MMMLMSAKLKIFMKKDKINRQLIKIFFEDFGLFLIIFIYFFNIMSIYLVINHRNIHFFPKY